MVRLSDKLRSLRSPSAQPAPKKEEPKEEPTPAQKEEPTPEPQEEPKEKPGASILAKLQEIGKRKLVNPEPKEEPIPEPTPEPKEEPKEEITPETSPGDKCPTCGNFYKVLARHKCKQAVPEEQLEQKQDVVEEATPEEKTEEQKEETSPPEEKEPPKIVKDFTLLIDCVPTDVKIGGISVIHASQLCEPIKEFICKEKNVEHYKMLDFGKGPALLQTRFEALLKQGIEQDLVYLDSRDIDAPFISEVLCKYARLVIRAVR